METFLSLAEEHLEVMGYELASEGVPVVLANKVSGYTPVEAASFIALSTLASDAREADFHVLERGNLVVHGAALIEVLTQYKNNKLMRETWWKNDCVAILKITHPSPEQEEWICKILSDPMSQGRLAKSKIRY